ncbi:MAG: hypothetical protein ACLFTK_01790 [Anaerolineales bacterium]
MTEDTLLEFLLFTNETLTAAIVILAASLLLYNLMRNFQDRVAQASAALLGCVTIAYTIDSIVGLDPEGQSLETWYRLQWIGLAFVPAAMFHLADALLATTGRPSRGRRRRILRMLYLLSGLLLILALFSDLIGQTLVRFPVTYLAPGPVFPVYMAYFGVSLVVSLRFVWRARARCLTTATRRRMTFFLLIFPAPGLGLFPYTPLVDLFGNSGVLSPVFLAIIFNLANLFVIFMLVFMAYPLSFFGTTKADRVVKTELLQFLLRSPFTAIVVLGAMVSAPRISNALGLNENDILIVSAIGVLLILQWAITVSMPLLEDIFIYTRDQDEAQRLRDLSERLLTRSDSKQLQEALLAAICDQFQAPSAFLAINHPTGPRLEQIIGEPPDADDQHLMHAHLNDLGNGWEADFQTAEYPDLYLWKRFWIMPLHDPSHTEDQSTQVLGILGIWGREMPPNLSEDERHLLEVFRNRAAKILSDLRLQGRVFEAVDNFAAEASNPRNLGGISRYGHVQKELLEDPEAFTDMVHGALRDFWGGPKLAESELIQLQVVQRAQDEHSGSPTRALQAVLTQAIDSLKPPGDRNMTTTEWILYNILDLRFLQGKKVSEVAPQLAMSESDFYRKQRVAIEEVARHITELERDQLARAGHEQSSDEKQPQST